MDFGQNTCSANGCAISFVIAILQELCNIIGKNSTIFFPCSLRTNFKIHYTNIQKHGAITCDL